MEKFCFSMLVVEQSGKAPRWESCQCRSSSSVEVCLRTSRSGGGKWGLWSSPEPEESTSETLSAFHKNTLQIHFSLILNQTLGFTFQIVFLSPLRASVLRMETLKVFHAVHHRFGNHSWNTQGSEHKRSPTADRTAPYQTDEGSR